MENKRVKSVILAVVFIVAAAISFWGFSKPATDIENYKKSTEQLESLKGQALGLTTAATTTTQILSGACCLPAGI